MITDLNETLDVLDRIMLELTEYACEVQPKALQLKVDKFSLWSGVVENWASTRNMDMRPGSTFITFEGERDPGYLDFQRRRMIQTILAHVSMQADKIKDNGFLRVTAQQKWEDIFNEQVKVGE